MDKNELVEQMRSSMGYSECFAFCNAMSRFIAEQPLARQPEALVWFFQMVNENYCYRKDSKPLSNDISNQLNDYSYKYKKIIHSLIDFFSSKGYEEEVYYQHLWNSLELLFPETQLDEKGFWLFIILWHVRTPYYKLPLAIQMPTEQFKKIIDDIEPYLRKMKFAVELSKDQRQRTELASHIVHLLDDLKTIEQKSVLLAVFLNRLKELWNENRLDEDTARTRDSAKGREKGYGRSSSDDKAIDATFLPVDIKKASDSSNDEIIAEYRYPDINGDKYDFALAKRGDEVFLSDKGKTLEQLDKIFELKEPDVVKNLNSILDRYGVVMNRNEFVVKIDNWNGNANEYENEELKKNILSLFSCVSFMLNMRIFYI